MTEKLKNAKFHEMSAEDAEILITLEYDPEQFSNYSYYSNLSILISMCLVPVAGLLIGGCHMLITGFCWQRRSVR